MSGILYSTISTRNNINLLSSWTGGTSLSQIISELKIAISNRSFILFFLGNLTLSISWGLLNSLTLFINTDFWGLRGDQIGIFLYLYFAAAFLAFAITPKFVSKIGKRNFVLFCVSGVALTSPMAFIFYNLGLTPEKGTTELVLFLCLPLIFVSTLSIAGNMARDAMIGDIADEVDLQSGKRQEGVLYSAVSFIQKVNTAFGALTGGLTLWVLNISKDTPTYDQAYALFFVQGVIGPILLVIPLIFFYFYSLDKKRHSEILMKIEERNNF
jgi:Na+/melibiose symporter-like transporter